jgi:hypothetical protein
MQNHIEKLLNENNLNYEVGKEKLLLAQDQAETPFYAMLRTDTRDVFGTCKEVYTPFQNEELMELAWRIQEETGHTISEATSYGIGEKVEVRLKTKDEVLEYGEVGDILAKGIGLTNSHDGSGSLRIALQTKVLSCTNGMTRWVNDSKTSIRHTKKMGRMVEQALRGMEIIKEAEATMMEEIQRMIGTPVTAPAINRIMQEVVQVDMRKVTTAWSSDDYSGRRVNLAKSLFESIEEEMQYKGSTMWGLLNGVTHYTTHKAGKDEKRDKRKVFGGLAAVDRKAYETVLELM